MRALAAQRGWPVIQSNDDDGVAKMLEPLIRDAQQARSTGNRGAEVVAAVVTSENGIRSR
jgi:hypothetical protein